MTVYIDAEELRDYIGTDALESTGSVVGDVFLLAEVLACTHDDVVSGREPWRHLDQSDPMASLARLHGMLTILYAHLREQGFRPPRVVPEEDPLAFLAENARFLNSIKDLVTEPAWTVH